MNFSHPVFHSLSKLVVALCFLGLFANLNAASVGLATGSPKVSIPFYDERRATIAVDVAIENSSDQAETVFVEIVLKDADGNEVARAEAGLEVAAGAQRATAQWMNFKRPKVWTEENPYLYTAHTMVLRGTDVIDSSKSSFGVGSAAHSGE